MFEGYLSTNGLLKSNLKILFLSFGWLSRIVLTDISNSMFGKEASLGGGGESMFTSNVQAGFQPGLKQQAL